jgi:hypothetical protein
MVAGSLPSHRNLSLRVTPAMEAGVADHVWSLEEVLALPGQLILDFLGDFL